MKPSPRFVLRVRGAYVSRITPDKIETDMRLYYAQTFSTIEAHVAADHCVRATRSIVFVAPVPVSEGKP